MEKEPKFNVGDWVILRLGEWKEITLVEDVTQFGDSFYYSVEGRHQSVPESALEPYESDGYEAEIYFEIGDLVTVNGYQGQYRVEAVSVTTHITADGPSHEVIYQLRGDSGMISAVDEDMRLVGSDPIVEFTPEDRKAPTMKERIDSLLDEMNDYERLYLRWGDAEYLEKREAAKEALRRLTRGGTA